MSKPIIVAISGPSGAGKTVLSNKLKDNGEKKKEYIDYQWLSCGIRGVIAIYLLN